MTSEIHKQFWNLRNIRGRKLKQLRRAHLHRWSYPTLLLPYIRDLKPTSILECGFGTLDDYRFLREDGYTGTYTGIEITTAFIEAAQGERDFTALQGDIEDIPFKDNSFDLIYSRGVIEMQSDFRKALHECLRVASKFVLLALLDLASWEPEIRYRKRHGCEQYLNRYSLSDIINATGGKQCLVQRRRRYTTLVIHI